MIYLSNVTILFFGIIVHLLNITIYQFEQIKSWVLAGDSSFELNTWFKSKLKLEISMTLLSKQRS